MAKAKVLLNFKNMSAAVLIKTAQAIVASMTGNANFPKPVPTIAVVAAALKKFADALAATVNRDQVKIYLKDEAREELENALIDLGNYINYTAAGDPAILATSGYPLGKPRNGKRTLGTIQNFSVQPGKNPGEMIASVDGVDNVKSYAVLWGPAPITGDKWRHMPGDATTVVSGLLSGVQYSFQVCAHGAHGQVAYSDVLTKWVG
jgi:hypothetical protein